MRNQWFIWILVVAVGVFVLYIFNYQNKQDSVSLTEIFPDKNKDDADIEYEFVGSEKAKEPVASPAAPAKVAAAPVAQSAQPAQTARLTQPTLQSQVQSQAKAQEPQAQPHVASSGKTASPQAASVKRVRQFGKVNEWVTVTEQEPAPAPVAKVQSVARGASSPVTVKTESASSRTNVPFTIQIGSYNDRQSAEVALKGIQAAGYPAYIGTRDLGAKGTKYRIYVGKYQSKAEANQSLSELKGKYRESFIISPKAE